MGSGSDAEFVGVKDDGDRTVVGEPHARMRDRIVLFYFESLCAQGVVESVPCLFGVRALRLSTKLGRLPLRTSAYSVNWEMDSTLPFVVDGTVHFAVLVFEDA